MIAEAATAIALGKCAWGATSSGAGCLAPYRQCVKAHQRAYRRHAYSCVAGRLQYDWSQLRRRPVRKPACTITPQQGTLQRNGYSNVPAWGHPASPWMPVRSLEVPVDYDNGFYAEW